MNRESETRAAAREAGGGKTISETQVALDQTTRDRGFGGGATANKPVAGGVPALSAEQTAAITDNFALALKPADDRAAAVPTVSLGLSTQTGRLEAANLFAFFGRPDGQLTQRFAQAQNYRRNLNSPPMPNVLNSFQLEQNGQQIRIIDADGSTYEGQIEGPQTESVLRAKFSDTTVAEELSKRQAGGALRRQNRALQNDGATIAGQNVWFQAAGTNRTLNQPVLFWGNLSITDTNAPNANAVNGIRAGVTLAPQSGAFPAQNAPPQNQLQFQNSRIQGQATIGASNRIEINAVPTAP